MGKYKTRVEDIAEFIKKNAKLEITVFVLLIMLRILTIYLPSIKPFNLKDVLTDDTLEKISTFFGIAIGIYITVISIFSTSITTISGEIIEEKLDKSFVWFISTGIIANMVYIIYETFIPVFPYYYFVAFLLISIAFISFIKFIKVVLLMFNLNMKTIIKTIDSQKSAEDDIKAILENIEKNTRTTSNHLH